MIYTEVVIVWWYTHRVRYAVPAPLKDCHFNRLSAITKLQTQPTNQILPHSQHFPPSATKFVPKSVSVLRSARWRENDGRKGESVWGSRCQRPSLPWFIFLAKQGPRTSPNFYLLSFWPSKQGHHQSKLAANFGQALWLIWELSVKYQFNKRKLIIYLRPHWGNQYTRKQSPPPLLLSSL